jgi:hypothetical protein
MAVTRSMVAMPLLWKPFLTMSCAMLVDLGGPAAWRHAADDGDGRGQRGEGAAMDVFFMSWTPDFSA